MSLKLVVPEDIPVAFWMLDGTSPFTDYSGRGQAASTPSTAYHAALVKDASKAIVVGSTSKLTMTSPVYRQGFEHLPFSVEVAFRSIKKDAADVSPQQVWGHAGAYDGIVIEGTVVHFVTKYANTGEARCSFDIQENRAVFAEGVHVKEKNSLYINGELVAEVDITPEQQEDVYATSSTNLSCGDSTGPNLIALNALSLYRNVLPDDAIDQHYEHATDNLAEAAVATAFGGANLDLTPEMANPYFTQTYSTESDWAQGRLSRVAVEYDQLVPQMRGGESIYGEWNHIVSLPQDLGTLYGVSFNWEGEGAKVETSVDGTTWSTVKRSMNTPTIPAGFDPVGKFLEVRVSFPGGIVDDQSYIDDLSIAVYTSNQLPPFDGRTVSLTSTSIEANADVLDYNENYGAEMTGGSIVISSGDSASMLPKTIEVWARKSTTASFSDNLFASSTNWYSNGSTGQSYQVDEWQLRTYTFAAGFSGPITFSGTGQIGTITMYPYVMTPEQVYLSYKSYTGVPSISTGVEDNINIIDIPELVDVYEYEWSVQTSA